MAELAWSNRGQLVKPEFRTVIRNSFYMSSPGNLFSLAAPHFSPHGPLVVLLLSLVSWHSGCSFSFIEGGRKSIFVGKNVGKQGSYLFTWLGTPLLVRWLC